MEALDLALILFVVFTGVFVFSIFSMAFTVTSVVERCKSHKWQYNENNKLVCSVCKYEAHSE